MSRVLVVNSGSSSLKYQLRDVATDHVVAGGLAERLGTAQAQLTHRPADSDPRVFEISGADHQTALSTMLEALRTDGTNLDDLVAVGHRVVHGGLRFREPTLLDDAVCKEIDDLADLAPLHNPANLQGIRALRTLLPDVAQVAVFDTAFHATMPPVAYTYALPTELVQDNGIRRYGFHGTSHQYVTHRAAAVLGVPVNRVNLVVCHIGNGVSVTAVEHGRSVDTSMGFTPLEGLVMGTRAGDVDPGALLYLLRSGLDVDGLDDLLNRQSGLLGLAGAIDIREVHNRADAGDARAQLALDVYAYRLRKYIGAYLAVVPGVDAVVFTAGVGEHDAALRKQVCAGLGHLGVGLNDERNTTPAEVARVVSPDDSTIKVLVVPTDEESQIAQLAAALVSGN